MLSLDDVERQCGLSITPLKGIKSVLTCNISLHYRL